MQKLYENIPWLPDDDPTEMPIIYDPCHSYENIKGLVLVIQSWFENRLSVNGQTSGKPQAVGKDATIEPHGVISTTLRWESTPTVRRSWNA